MAAVDQAAIDAAVAATGVCPKMAAALAAGTADPKDPAAIAAANKIAGAAADTVRRKEIAELAATVDAPPALLERLLMQGTAASVAAEIFDAYATNGVVKFPDAEFHRPQ